MKTSEFLAILLASACAVSAIAQDSAQPSPPRSASSAPHEPPPQAYADCKGRKAGDAIQHTTPDGKVAATCQESPKGLVARPNQPKGASVK